MIQCLESPECPVCPSSVPLSPIVSYQPTVLALWDGLWPLPLLLFCLTDLLAFVSSTGQDGWGQEAAVWAEVKCIHIDLHS